MGRSGILAAVIAVMGCASSHRAHDYGLPFPRGTTAKVIQGNNGRWGHTGPIEYAYDFALPMGSPVAAARSGRVIKVESHFDDGTKKPGEENYVFVDHGDGTFGRYYHLMKNGVLVSAGERVRAGQVIARSGNSGASAGPHLHFDVTTKCPEWGCQTVPIRFEGVTDNPLHERTPYTAN